MTRYRTARYHLARGRPADRSVRPCSTSPIYISQLGDETFLVLEGEVDVKDLDTGKIHHFGKGDFCSWSKGMRTEWTIKGPFKKFFVVAGRE